MPLIECPDCLHQISDAAPACPHCGHPFRAKAPPIIPQPKPHTVRVEDTVMTRNRGCGDILLVILLIGGGLLAFLIFAAMAGLGK